MTLADKLNTYKDDYWDFADYSEVNPIIQYPAKMVTPMQRQLLIEVNECEKNIQNILDPFMGSGTVLSIGRELGLSVTGYDINPLASLISRVRIEGIPKLNAKQNIDYLSTRLNLNLGNVEPFYFRNIEKWFRNDVIESLSLIRACIMGEPNIKMRRFYWCCFAEVVKKYSNTRSSTFKLHIKEQAKISSMQNNCIAEFKRIVRLNYNKFCFSNVANYTISTGDSIKLLTECKENSFDLICTSPPYGDNHTTVTYGQYSILPLLWINVEDLDPFDNELLDKFSAIDRESLGGRIKKTEGKDYYYEFLENIDPKKQKKVISFWYDYEMIYEQMSRVLKQGKLLILTLGNRRVDNKEIPFDLFNDCLAEKYGLELESTITRKILKKRMPIKVSNVKNVGAVQSMNKEYIKIYRKK